MLSTLSLRAKLFLLAFLGVTGTIVVGGIGYLTLGTSVATVEGLSTSAAAQRARMQGDLAHVAMRSDVYSAILAAQMANETRRVRAEHDLLGDAKVLKEAMASVAGESRHPDIVKRAQSLRPDIEALETRARAVQLAAASGDKAALAPAVERFEEAFATLERELGALGKEIEVHTARLSAASASAVARAKLIVMLSSVLLILIALALGFLIERGITTSLSAVVERVQTLRGACIAELRAALDAMTRGDLAAAIAPRTQLLPVTSTDEIGVLTTNVNDIIAQTQATVASFEEARRIVRALIEESNALSRAAREGELSQRGDAAAFDGSFRALVEGINHTLDLVIAPVNAATETLERLAQRDLTSRVEGNYRGDHARIQQSLNSALDKLSEAMGAVTDTAQGVASSAQQIDAGSKELARGASDQAASLEEVSASARELAAMTRRNAASAAEGRSLSEGARASTSAGVLEVRRLADAIVQIQQSAVSTARIVRTIDEIAFQTNLLALNAAVEAARAGDSGKGFAVVADEVRTLAMRSAEAARSTAELIEQSVRATEQGVALNAQVLQQLSEIDDRVNRVGQVVGEIAVASDEQSKGVELIDRALEEMSRRTQAVAAAADESEEASRNLGETSEALRALVGEFRLARRAAPTRAAATHAVTEKVAAPHVAPDKAPTARVVPERPAAARLTPNKAPAARAVPNKAPAARAVPDKPAVAHAVPASSSPTSAASKAFRVKPPPSKGAPPKAAARELPEISIPLDDDDWNSMQSF
ncbi:MAG: hypothetical protein IT359_12080 [Gemmatimonadaceae bacterium]|nr:hypothetical protein [Gemmatimonadaceae bacterium]